MARGRGVRTLILSDVVGNDPSTIGSGPTVADPTTFADARAVLRKYDLLSQVPPPVLAVLEAGSRGEAEETIKPTDPLAAHATATVIGDNLMACRAAARARLDWDTNPSSTKSR
jgi:glycerate-2-kinase